MAFVLGLVVLFIMGKALSFSFKLIFKLALNVIIGGAVLFAINFVGGYFGYNIVVNPVTAFIVGVFGVPGLALIIILKMMLGI